MQDVLIGKSECFCVCFELYNAPVNVMPQEGAAGIPRAIDNFLKIYVNIPTQGHLFGVNSN